MSTESDTDNTKMEAFLRNWRQTAFNAGQFQTAIFVGDKLLALTSTLPTTPVSQVPQCPSADASRLRSRRRQ